MKGINSTTTNGLNPIPNLLFTFKNKTYKVTERWSNGIIYYIDTETREVKKSTVERFKNELEINILKKNYVRNV